MKEAYEGNKPYIFISYSHKDTELISPFMEELQKHFNVWYDDGIHLGEEWTEEVARHLTECTLFIYLVTNNSLSSKNCKDEINLAREEDIPFFNVLVEDVSFPPEFKLRYSRFQMYKLFECDSVEKAIQDIRRKAPEIEKTLIEEASNEADDEKQELRRKNEELMFDLYKATMDKDKLLQRFIEKYETKKPKKKKKSTPKN